MIGAVIMFFSYLVGGMFSIIPTLLFRQPEARIIAIMSSFVGLFLIGYLKGYLVEHKPLRSAIELFIIGSIATTIGLIVGHFLKV
jgi:VIT1/CCC1 family predicted Fe2+/Mn2+ transporter